MVCWTHYNMWLLFIAGLQVGLLTALAPDSICDPNTEFSCRNDSSICLALSRVRDGRPDCPDRSDEECNEEEFQCQSIHQCIPRERFHDGWPDCDDGSDEECGRGQFRCRCGIPHCIEGSKVKDGTKDCEDGSDEEKSQKKTDRCPDESRLQDLLAVEKRRRKRQIHAYGTSSEDGDGVILDEKVLDIQPSTASGFSNNFQYSYTKFLNERLSREEYKPMREAELPKEKVGNIKTTELHHLQQNSPPKSFGIRTETDQYGSLNSGKIYQTAVNEPISVIPSAEATIMEFDYAETDKKYFIKTSKEKIKKVNDLETRSFGDLMLKIAALFQNDSEINPSKKMEINKENYAKNKTFKNPLHRKLLSLTHAEEFEIQKRHLFKRSKENSDIEISHIPLVLSTTVPYVPQSDIHTTGIVMSTTGTDIIGGRTTEWTTIIEGTYIRGTYAHIVHSTSRIYYTVDTPILTTDNLSNKISHSIPESNMDATSTNSFLDNGTEDAKVTTVKELKSHSQRTNDKSLKDLDVPINHVSRSREFSITPTAVFSTLLDITTVSDETKTQIAEHKHDPLKIIFTGLFQNGENNFNVLATTIAEESEINSTRSSDMDFIGNTALNKVSTESSPTDISEILPIDINKNIDFDDEKPLIFESELGSLNLVGRMVGTQNSEQNSNNFSSSLENGTPNSFSDKLNIKDEIIPTRSSIQDIETLSKSELSEDMLKESIDRFEESKEFIVKSSIIDLVSSSEVVAKYDNTDMSLLITENFSPMETSLAVPEISDLLAVFSHGSVESSKTNLHSDVEEKTLLTSKQDNSTIILSSSVAPSVIRNDEGDFATRYDDVSLNNLTEIFTEYPSTSESFKNITNLTENESDRTPLFPRNLNNSNNIIESRAKEHSAPIHLNNEKNITDIPNELIFSSENLGVSINSADADNLNDTEDTSMLKPISLSPPIVDELSEENTKMVLSSITLNIEPTKNSEVMVFLGIASTLDSNSKTSSLLSLIPAIDEVMSEKTEKINISASENSKFVNIDSTSEYNNTDNAVAKTDPSPTDEITKSVANDMSDITVLLLPSMNLEDLKNLMTTSLSSSMRSLETEIPVKLITTEEQNTEATPALEEFALSESLMLDTSEKEYPEETRVKRAVSESVTILRPGGRIVSTDAHIYLKPTTHYTTYTYFTTVLIPGGGTEIRSSLHVDSVILQPTDRAVYGYDENGHDCNECRIRNTGIRNDYETRYLGRPLTEDHYHVETVPYDISRASEITHRTTYTYYTTRLRGGTPFVETRKETKTDITPLPTGRYSPFEIGTYYDGGFADSHFETEAPRIGIPIPDDITHRTTYTYYTTRLRNGVPIVETRKVTDTNAIPFGTDYRPGSHVIRTSIPIHYQTIDPNLYKPDRVTHRTTYTYHTTRFRDGQPIVNTRKETETNVTPIPTYLRPRQTNRPTRYIVDSTRPAAYNYNTVTETYNPYNRQDSNPYITHRTTFTYYTTRLIGRNTHVDTSYVTETNVTPYPSLPHIRGTTYTHHYDDHDHHDNECTVCRDAERSVINRYEPNNIVRSRATFRPGRRSERVDPEVLPSTATIYSTYTYATTQLARSGTPVVRTREHTVTEVLSDVVLPTLKFGDRIRSKRTVKPEEMTPKNTVDTIHVVPIRHTFSRTNSYADGRQGRRISINEQTPNRVNRLNNNHGRNPYLNGSNARRIEINRSHNSNNENKYEIEPTNVTYYSTYTYFTTELSDGTPVIKSREHTVTEILTDVIVPTVSAVRHPSTLQATQAYKDSLHIRNARNINFSENKYPLRRLLSLSADSENVAKEYAENINLKSSKLPHEDLTNEKFSLSQNPNPLEHKNLLSSTYSLQSSQTLTPPLEILYMGSSDSNQDNLPREINNEFLAHGEDLTPSGAEIRRAIVPSPVTHYTTYTYYTTKLKPGGSRIVETSTKVSSSIIYSQPTQLYGREEYSIKPNNEYKLHNNQFRPHEHRANFQTRIHSSPVSQILRTQYPSDTLYDLGSQAVHRSSNPYRRPVTRDYQQGCSNCGSLRNNQRLLEPPVSYDRITRVQKNNYLTRVPVGNRLNNARRIPDRAPNDVNYPDTNIKPTHVTFYSTYTYFTTEPVDGSSVVRSREHTVTEILTDVIIPTVASYNNVRTTRYEGNSHHRSKRYNLKNNMISLDKYKLETHISGMGRKLLSLDAAEIFTNGSFLFKTVNFDNFTATENEFALPESNFNGTNNDFNKIPFPNEDEILNKGILGLTPNASNVESFRRSEIFNNDTSQLFEISSAPKTSDNPTLKEFIVDSTDKGSNSELIDRENVNLTEIIHTNSSEDINIFLSNKSFNLDEIKETKLDKLKTVSEEYISESTVSNFNENNDELINLPTSTLNIFAANIRPTKTVEEINTHLYLNSDLNFNPENENLKSVSNTLENGFLDDTPSLPITKFKFRPSSLDASFSVLRTPSVDKLKLTNLNTFPHLGHKTLNSYNAELFSIKDLDVEGAELRHVIIATPTTHFTTYTYYSTVLKPGGKRETITNTKVTGSTYYPHVVNAEDTHYRRNIHRPTYDRISKVTRHDTNTQAPKAYDLYPERAVVRNQYVLPSSKSFESYKPSFATPPQYQTFRPHRRNGNRCVSCNDNYSYNKNMHNSNENKYLTRIPVRGVHTHQRGITNPNTIPYEVPDIKPTSVTFYSTYTYFTTELQNGSPVVRSREHTVTEILTDVIVPTVASAPHTRHTKYLNARSKRSVENKEFNNNSEIKSPFQRKLLSEELSSEISEKEDKLLKNVDALNFPTVNSQILNSAIKEYISGENDLIASFNPQQVSPTVQIHTATPIEINTEFLGNAQISKAFEAYLAFLESSSDKPENLTVNDSKPLNVQDESDELNLINSTKQISESLLSFTTESSKSTPKSMISVLTSDMKKNGRVTKYTTTIYGTYINGVYAQRAKSRSDIIPITDMDIPPPDATVMFSPSRMSGLVRSIVSRKIRGPVAVHLTTEIHGTFVGGAYAQTARVFTSSQPLSSTRESSRHRIQPYTTTIPQGTRKTGLLSTKILRSKIDGSKTLLFVSEIYGTHIGGAYAHLGTYTTRTIIQSTSTNIEPEPTSTSLPTYYMEDLSTGLVTASISEKLLNGTTTRYHYQVYGTYLDGTYAHVPSISTETLLLQNEPTPYTTSQMEASLESEITAVNHSTASSSLSDTLKLVENQSSKIGLIHASTRAHVINGTTTQHIFEVHGTFLSGNYAHVPSVSVRTILPSTTQQIKETIQITKETKETIQITPSIASLPDSDFEVLTIFSDFKSQELKIEQNYQSTTLFSDINISKKEIADVSIQKNIPSLDSSSTITSTSDASGASTLDSLKNSDYNEQSSNLFPVLLPEALRLSFSRDTSNHRAKRNDPFSPYLRSSFTSSIKNQQETHHVSLTITAPLPTSAFSELCVDCIKNVTKSYSQAKMFPSFFSKTKNKYYSTIKDKISASKGIKKSRMNLVLKRSKRSPAAIRSTFGSSKRFGASSSSARKFVGSSSAFNRDTRSKSNTGYRSSTRNSINPSKSLSRAQASKSIPNFLSRTQRVKPILPSKTTSVKPTSTSSTFVLPSLRLRRFGKKESDPNAKMVEDFEASEAIPQSVTEEKIKPSETSTSRFRRPTKLLKINARSTSTSARSTPSRSNKISSNTSRRSRMQHKSIYPVSRAHKNNFRDYDYDVTPTISEPVESTSVKRRFTLTTTFEINLKSTAGFMTPDDDIDSGNNLQSESISKNKRKNKNRSSSNSYRHMQENSYKPIFDSDENEVKSDKPKSLPLPVFGRSRSVKRPPKFDPRTMKSATATQTSTITYLTSSLNETRDLVTENSVNGPITVTDVFTTVKTLPVHLGPRTSFATITTTAFTTSTIQPHDLSTVTIGGITKTILSAITGLPDANLPMDKQFTVLTEVILTTTEIESTSLVAIKVGFGTRTDTIVVKQKMTTLATQTNTIREEKTTSVPFQQQYPYFPNPFGPPMPNQNTDFSLSLSENSFVSTQTITSTTVLPLFFNGKTVLTTLTSTSLSEETLVKTTTFKVPHQPTMPPFVFPQPVFILPSVTTQITVQFTAHNGEVFSIVTLITVPLALNGHTRFARSVTESYIDSTATAQAPPDSSYSVPLDKYSSINTFNSYEELNVRTHLDSSFSTNLKEPLSSQITETLHLSSADNNDKNLDDLKFSFKSTKSTKSLTSKVKDFETYKMNTYNLNKNDIGLETYNARKLLQFVGVEEIIFLDKIETDKNVDNLEKSEDVSGTQSSTTKAMDDYTHAPETFHLLGPGFNEDGLSRPIPPVRVVPTRRAYVRRLNPSGPQNRPYEGNEDEFNFRRNNQNFPANFNIPPGADFNPVRPELFADEPFGPRRNVPSLSNRPVINQDGPINNFGTLRNVQYFAPNRPSIHPVDSERDLYSQRVPTNYASNRPNRIQENQPNLNTGRNPSNFPPLRNNRPLQVDGFDARRNLPSYSPIRQNVPSSPPREETTSNNNLFGEEAVRNQVNRPLPTVTPAPRRVIRLRRPGNSQQSRPQSSRELMDRKPIVNSLPDEKEPAIRARGPVVLTNTATVLDIKNPAEANAESNDDPDYTEALPLTYYTTFTYMTTFLNGPSTAYSTREAVVSNIATETLNPKLVEMIRSRGGFTTFNGVQTAVPLGSRSQGATTTIVNLASRVQLYNSDVYYGRLSKPDTLVNEDLIKPTATILRTIPITDIASLPKTYYTLFTYFYTLRDGDKSMHSQRSETISNIDSQTEPFILQDFASTIDSSGLLTLKPNKQIVNLGLRTAGGTTTEVNLELKTVVHLDGLKNAVIDRGSMTPTLVEVIPSETNSILNNYLDPDDAEVQDQQTYPQTVPIQPSFSSANEVYEGTQRSSSNKEATPEIPSNNRIIRTQSIRGPLRVASTILQRPGTLRSGVFAPRPGVRVRVRPVSSRILSSEEANLSSLQPDITSYRDFDSSRSILDDANDFDEEDVDVTEEDDEYTTEEALLTEDEESQKDKSTGRKRLKITIRRSPGISTSRTSSALIRPTRTRPRFYVVTRTASPTGGPGGQPKRPVSVKVSRRPRPSTEPEYETYTTVTSVPVVFGLSTTYRNAIVTSSSLVTPEVVTTEPSRTVILTYFTTTTYTVPYTVDGVATYTTLEETNSRIATETLDPNADLSFVSTTTLDYGDEISVSSADIVRQPAQTLKPQLVNNQLNVGPRINLATKISNGVTLIVATDGEAEATHVVTQPPLTLRPTIVTDALLMMNKDITTVYEPRTFYTTFTFFTTFFSGSTPSISTSEQVITNIYSVPVTHSITRTQPAFEPFTVVETTENLVSTTLYTTHTFYATLFNGTGTIVTPIEELQSSVISSTETYTITKTIMPTSDMFSSEVLRTQIQPSTTTTSIYRTRTNFVTLFRGSESTISPLEEIETEIVTLTLDNRVEQPTVKPIESYTTRTIQATNTHYITLFSGSESILSSITEVAPSVITELVKQLQEPTTTPFMKLVNINPSTTISSSSSSVEPTFQDLVPSIRTQYTTLTYFTTLFTDSSTILSSREEIATSYITLFVPAPVAGATSTENIYSVPSKTDILTHGSVIKPSNVKKSSITPTSEILTFYTTYTYYTTLFRGTETIISDSETIVTQYVTIESTPSDTISRHTTSLPPMFSRPNYSDTFEVRVEPSSTIVASPTFNSASSNSSNKESSLDTSEEELQIIGISTKVESDNETPSILTGIPSTDANGATHILFTDFIVPSSIEESPSLSTELSSEDVTSSLPDVISSVIISELSSASFDETMFYSHETSTPSSARDSASDLATTRLTDAHIATHHMILRPTTSYNSGSSQTLGIKPGAVIDLSDVLTNTNLVGNLGETIKDIVNLFAANGNRAKNISSKASTSTSDSSIMPPSGGITVSSAEDPVYIPIGAIARSTKISTSVTESKTTGKVLHPSTMLSGFTPIIKEDNDANKRKIDSSSPDDITSGTLTSIVFGSNTIFIQPTDVITEVPSTVLFSDMDGRFHSSFNTKIQGSVTNLSGDQQHETPGIKYTESTSTISGHETIFFGFPDARQPPQVTTQIIQGSASTSSVVGYETIFFDSPGDFYMPGSNQVNITGDTTIFGTFPAVTESSISTSSTPDSTFTSTSSGETTIFFPVPGDNQHQSPGTRYVTSVESVTLTLTLTTSSVYQTDDTPVTVTSVFTTTIPPRTFVSTIIGDRTILGTQPEPTEAVQVIPTMQPSESTTTVTTTTLIFNSIATTVVRTLVIPTNGIQPTRASTSTATETVNLGGLIVPSNERAKVTTEKATINRKPIQLFKSGSRPTDPTTPKPLRTGPPLKLFPTKPPTTAPPPTRPTTTRKNTFRKPGKTLVPITDGCLRECNLKNKEVCKQNPDKTWSCQCRPGFFKKNGSEECRDVKSYVVLVRVLKMGDNEVTYSPGLSNHLSQEYKNLTTTARNAVDDAYKTSSVRDDFVSTNVISVGRDNGVRREGVLVNLKVELSGEKLANEAVLKEELEQSLQSLEAAASEISFANATFVSPIIQRVEDVQDFDECYDDTYNDCSRSSVCINLPGTYTCECKDGYQDLEILLPGRICSGEIKDCDYCNNRGVCIMTEDDNKFCRCYRMYLGKQCEINGLVLAIALPIALALLILTMFCLLCGCRKLRQRRAQKPKPNVFKGMVPPLAGTLDRKAMIMDSSSESSGEHRPPIHPAHAYDGFGDDVANSTMKRSRRSEPIDDHISEFQVPTVLIPRAKHSHPKQVNAPYPNYRMPHPRSDMDGW